MKKILFLPILMSFFACSGGGIEGYVGESISITADNPEEGKDVDYNWTLENQPDGSLMNSTDLSASDNGQKISFIPDYPGNYSVEVVVSQYGDDIGNQTFSFSIIDPYKHEEEKEQESQNEVNEEWLNEDLEKESDLAVNDENDYSEEIEDNLDSDSDSDDEEEEIEDEEEEIEDENDVPVAKIITSKAVKAKAIQSKKGASIAAKTDQFTIQITSKRVLNDAQLFSQKMIRNGYDAYIQKALFDTDKIWYRVRVGSYDNYNSAKIAADALSEKLGMATWVDFVRKE
tara:strand:+ start:596 stop:1456 length:861 start_codon:yes stop_codon:yes gene_type:complete